MQCESILTEGVGESDATLSVAVAIVAPSLPAMLVVAVDVVAVVVATDATVEVSLSLSTVSVEVDILAGGVVVDDAFDVELLSSGGGDASSHRAWLRTSSLTFGLPPCHIIT